MQARGLVASGRARILVGGEKLRHHLLAFANQEEIDIIRDRFGIEEDGGTAGDDERIVAPEAIGAAQRNPGHPQERYQVEVVGLERDREREDFEIGERTTALEGNHRHGARTNRGTFVGVGQKGAVGGDAWVGFEDVKDGLKAEIGHREAIDVWIDDAHADVAASVALVEHFFVGDALDGALAWIHMMTALYDLLG
jgi:hypothetical protein